MGEGILLTIAVFIFGVVGILMLYRMERSLAALNDKVHAIRKRVEE